MAGLGIATLGPLAAEPWPSSQLDEATAPKRGRRTVEVALSLTEKRAPGCTGTPARSDARDRLLFDVTGVVHWYAFFSHPSGIQRVTEKLISRLAVRPDANVAFVARMLGSDAFYRIDAGLLADLDVPLRRSAAIARLRALFAGSMRLASLRMLLADARYYHAPYIVLGLLRLCLLYTSPSPRD